MKIGILTITPNIGYGGIMQAYALQTILKKLGNEIEIINYRHKIGYKTKAKFFLKSVYKVFIKGEFAKFSLNDDYLYRAQKVSKFHQKYLNLSELVKTSKEFRCLANRKYDCIIVGSDQVWRPQYVVNIYDYYLDGIRKGVYKMSYAASFGVNEWQYSKEQTRRCTKLLKEFGYISVRESSGIKLIADNLSENFKVDWDLDPTLLIYQNDYASLIQNVPKNKNTLFTYILDPTFDKSQVVNKISKELNLGINEFNTRAENGMGVELKLRVAPPVETWISGFRDADFIVTDSFHGMVFSIIFNKPFVVYINPNRGTERFTSLLSMLGLLDRMITCSTELNQSLLSDTIVWNKVNDVINIKRKDIMSKLSRNLVSHIFNNQ